MQPSFGERLGRWLAHLDITQAELARRLGRSRAAVCGWVSGDSAPPGQLRDRIPEALGIELAQFYGELPEAREATAN